MLEFPTMTPLLIPPRLAPGDTIGLVAPASSTEKPERIDEVIAHLESRGFGVKPGVNLRRRTGYLAGTDAERAADFNAMFADPEVKAVFALRGGYGSCRILPLIDYDAIRANPKIFLGYSDITALHHALLVKAGVVTYHGPNANEAFQVGNNATLRQALMEPVKERRIFSRETKGGDAVRCEVSGRVKGRLLGGNMTCLLRLIGTPYAPDFTGAILFLEDIGEKAYRIDGMFTHLRLAGVLDQIAGLVLGRFDHTDPEEQARIETFLSEEAARIGKPCLSHAPVGHFPEQTVIPIGMMAELHTEASRVTDLGCLSF
jgi:muramoyltetrapeptide carboxypeptidase